MKFLNFLGDWGIGLLGCPHKRTQRRAVDVGWAIQADKASLIWATPRRFGRNLPKAQSVKSVQACPAAIDFDARHYVIDCPLDLHLRLAFDDATGQPKLINMEGAQSAIRAKSAAQMISIVSRQEWRQPDRPIIQIVTPYIFLADEPVYVNQLPPYLEHIDHPLPGLMICGRFPTHIWPRHLMWAFEWHNTKKDLILRRGAPWFYVRFEGEDPSRPTRLLEAEMKPDVREYINSITGVTNYVKHTFSLFDLARQRRPKTLLYRKL